MATPLSAGAVTDGAPNLTVVTHNVDAAVTDVRPIARTLLAAGPDLVGLREVT